MKHSKILKRSDGSRVEIEVILHVDFSGCSWSERVYICAPKKRSFFLTYNPEHYDYRAMSIEKRREHERDMNRKYATDEEILLVKKELWEKLNPANSLETQ